MYLAALLLKQIVVVLSILGVRLTTDSPKDAQPSAHETPALPWDLVIQTGNHIRETWQASFTALNIVPDDHAEDEIDNTKEIQIEDALKLYQVALKLHSQGPEQYEKATIAYQELLSSDIFKYLESESEFHRVDNHPELEYVDATIALELAVARADGAPSNLPQILFLSYKNYGQFILDCVKLHLQNSNISPRDIRHQGMAAVENFSLALASDESDTDLWRRTARVTAMLGSRRITRYCLEAAVEVDDDPTVAEIEPASLEEGFAGEQLKDHLEILCDEISLSHPIMTPFLQKIMPYFLSKYKDPYPYLPDETRTLRNTGQKAKKKPECLTLKLPDRKWSTIADRFCEVWMSSEIVPPGSTVEIQIPPEFSSQEEIETVGQVASFNDTYGKDIEMKDLPSEKIEEPSLVPSKGTIFNDELVKINSPNIDNGFFDENLPPTITLPTRKRSQSAAGIREARDFDFTTQKRSKRIRNRDSINEESTNPATQFAEKLEKYVQGDEVVFNFVGDLLKKLDVNELGTISELQTALSLEFPNNRKEIIANTALRDLREILKSWDEAKASVLVDGNTADILGSSSEGENAGLAAFLNQRESGSIKTRKFPTFNESKGLDNFVKHLNSMWVPLQDAIFEWMLVVIPTHTTKIWPEKLKSSVEHLINCFDADIFTRFQFEAELLRSNGKSMTHIVEMTQAMYEIHLDIYAKITSPSSTIPYNTRYLAQDRLTRWAFFAGDIVESYISDLTSHLSLRYFWASVLYATMADDVSREHKVSCWSDLENHLREVGEPVIEIPNNTAMPEISAAAANREASKLTTMEFFFNLFHADRSDPVAIIETLEPVLDPESAVHPQIDVEDVADSSTGNSTSLRDMWKFLKSGSTSLRLFLWQRLREAYYSIGYNTKVFSCHLKSIEVIVKDLRSTDYVDSCEDSRQHKLLTWLKGLDDLLVKALTIALNDSATCFEIIDGQHLKSTCTAIAQLSRFLHAATIFDDEVRVKMVQLPATAIYGDRGSFNSFTNKLREMQVRTWTLQYLMLKEAMSQYKELFPNPDNQMAGYLALVHYALGIRKYCKVSNKIFLKMMKLELIRLKHIDHLEDYLGQVLYDLYGLKLGVGPHSLEEHGCPTEQLDKKTVLNIADLVIALANKLPMKDLLKHDLRATIERMQVIYGQPKITSQMQHNIRNFNHYLKTSIRPLEMHQAWKGQIQMNSLPATSLNNSLAKNGWYFLLGMISLTKYRSTKRLAPGPQSDDIRAATSFFRLNLQCNVDHWETWYHLAQCFDYELEEEVLWSTDKINNHRNELVKMQRNAIHCYTMATSNAQRMMDDSFKTSEKLSEMYQDFAMRLYASSREPFGMEAFYVDDFEKHMSGSSGMYKVPLHTEMTKYKVWKFAAKLFKASLRDRSNNWMNHYMLAKCLWKMFLWQREEQDSNFKENNNLTVQRILKACTDAIKSVPKPSKSSIEPIIEPHYKIVSIVHKLVIMEAITAQAGADLIQQQPYAARKLQPVIIKDTEEEWGPYIIDQIRNLRKEDKQHWQHRMIARVASLLYNQESHTNNQLNAIAAKNEFRESMFTKTMQIQVWKPESERAGRHCVYMGRYTRRMVQLLEITNDKFNLEALVKRVRKKGNEFYKFSEVWTEACTAYLRIIRRTGSIPSSVDDLFKSVPADEFDLLSDRLSNWIADPLMHHPALEALRDTSELKKLNANFMKPAPIDDLINDAWAVLYTEVAKGLPIPNFSGSQMDTSMEDFDSLKGPNIESNESQIYEVAGVIGEPIRDRPRKIGVARREVLRRAEAAVNRTSDQQRSSSLANGGKPLISNLILGSNVNILTQKDKSRSITGNEILEFPNSTGCESEGSNPVLTESINNADGDEEGESERGSLHDSADDESDLSDVPGMDDIDSASIFPNLIAKNSHGVSG